MNPRRHFLRYAGLGLVTGFAGCSNEPSVRRPDDSIDSPITAPGGNEDPDDGLPKPPEKPPAYFRTQSGDEFDLYKLPDYRDEQTDLTRLFNGHLDDRIIDVTVDDSTVTVAFRAKLHRALDFTLHIRDASGDFQTREHTLEAPDGETRYVDHEFTFGISNTTLPRDAGGFLEISVTDTFDTSLPAHSRELLFKHHQFVGVSHDGGTRWFNNDTLNVQNYRAANGRMVSKTPSLLAGVSATEDNGDQRTVFLVTRANTNGEVFGVSTTVFLVTRANTNGEVFGVSTTVDKGFYRQYENASENWRWEHSKAWECHFATEVGHLRELARKTHDAITAIGLTSDLDKLNALGDLVQTAIPYGTPIQEECPPIIVLHDTLGDCSEKTGLMNGILANDPWNVRTAYIDCKIGDVYHFTTGIDKRDFDHSSANVDIHWVNAVNSGPREANLPDTEYAFFEMTADLYLGQLGGGVTDIAGIYDVGTYENQYHGSDTPPDY